MSDLMQDQPSQPAAVDVAHSDLAVISYTSGTVGKPKGVCLTHHNLVANALQTRHWMSEVEYGKEVVMAVVPFEHSYGMTTAMNLPILIAAKIVIISVFELRQVLEQIQRYKPTLFPGVPSMFTLLNQAPNIRNYGMSSIKACISGAAPLPIEVQEAFEKLTRGRLVEGYGLTEAGPVTHSNPLYGLRQGRLNRRAAAQYRCQDRRYVDGRGPAKRANRRNGGQGSAGYVRLLAADGRQRRRHSRRLAAHRRCRRHG